MIQTFIVIKNNKIIKKSETGDGIEVIENILNNNQIEFDEIKEIPNICSDVKVGRDVREYTAEYAFKSYIDRVKEGYEELPENKKIEGDEIVDKTIKDKIDEGTIELKDTEIYDEELQTVRPKNTGELCDSGLLSLDNYKRIETEKISQQCYSESNKILPQAKQMNVLVGGDATANYPDYLKGETGKANIAKFINIYQTIYHNTESAINSATTREDVDNVISNLTFPTEAEILQQLGV